MLVEHIICIYSTLIIYRNRMPCYGIYEFILIQHEMKQNLVLPHIQKMTHELVTEMNEFELD